MGWFSLTSIFKLWRCFAEDLRENMPALPCDASFEVLFASSSNSTSFEID
jgi:hypothetical protein